MRFTGSEGGKGSWMAFHDAFNLTTRGCTRFFLQRVFRSRREGESRVRKVVQSCSLDTKPLKSKDFFRVTRRAPYTSEIGIIESSVRLWCIA